MPNTQTNRPIVGDAPALARALDDLSAAARTDAPVLFIGESGTGKELFARALHERSARRHGPFVALNCAALPETLLETELFGHERGAFTAAHQRRAGRFEAADGGTLFLDEIGEITLAAQAKLLRVLQEGCLDRLGGQLGLAVDVRVVAATHRDLRARIADGLFREDFYYRLRVVEVQIPPLRSRMEDLPALVEHVLARHLGGGPTPGLTESAWRALSSWHWPGNVRELEHAVTHAAVLSGGGPIDLPHLPAEVAEAQSASLPRPRDLRPLGRILADTERTCLVQALKVARGKRNFAAEILGISRKSLWQKMRQHGLEREDFEGEAARAGGALRTRT